MKIITYTFSDLKDVWPIYFDTFKQYYPEIWHTVISNYKSETDFTKEEWVIYDPTEKYTNHWLRAINSTVDDTFIYSQEDFFLYDRVDSEKIDSLNDLLLNSEYDFIRLLRSGETGELVTENLYRVPDCSLYSMQATIWKTDRFKLLYETALPVNHRDEESIRKVAVTLGIKGLYWYNGEKKRGMNHYDSSIYPYIATALVQGRWNLIEYRKELFPIIEKYKIDTRKRGTMLYY